MHEMRLRSCGSQLVRVYVLIRFIYLVMTLFQIGSIIQRERERETDTHTHTHTIYSYDAVPDRVYNTERERQTDRQTDTHTHYI